jgi:hypothetical protein
MVCDWDPVSWARIPQSSPETDRRAISAVVFMTTWYGTLVLAIALGREGIFI